MVGELAAARAAVTTASDLLDVLGDAELAGAVESVAALSAQVAALRLALLAEADRREVAARHAFTGTDAWAARLTGTSRAVVTGGLWLAQMLQERYPATKAAFASGSIGEDQARIIVRAAETLPLEVAPEQRAEAERELVAKAAAGLEPGRLRQVARRMAAVFSAAVADRHEAAQLNAEEQRAENECWLTLHDRGDGTCTGRFVVPELHGHLLRTALERLTAPRRWNRNPDGALVRDDSLPGDGPTLNWSERLGSGFCELLEHLPTDRLGPVSATVLVTLDHQRLLDGLASAGLDTGARISAGQARRLACGAGILPAVLGGESQPLDLGRTRRLHTEAMRRALALAHDTCAAEGCERPFAWSEIHHVQPWSAGGPTSVANAVPLCGFHHRRAHDSRFRHRIDPVGTVRFTRRT